MRRAGPDRRGEVLAPPARALLRPGPDRALQEVWQGARADGRAAPDLDDRAAAGDARCSSCSRRECREAAGADPRPRRSSLLDRGPVPEVSYLLGRGSVTSPQGGRHARVPPGADSRRVARGVPGPGSRSASRAGDRNDRIPVLGTTYQRAALAEWLTDVDHGAGGLLARVIVNRLWQHHFGEGLVRTPDDFGTTGDRPDHAELLDWLAAELIRGGWRLKPIHRLIVTSAAYRQGDVGDPRRRGRRPRQPPALAPPAGPARGRGGPRRDARRLRPAQPGDVRAAVPAADPAPRRSPPAARTPTRPTSRTDPEPGGGRSTRSSSDRLPTRSPRRSTRPDSTAACGRRNTTTVPTQNLALLNDPFVRVVRRRPGPSRGRRGRPRRRGRVRRAYELALGRPPRADELAAALEFLGEGDGPDALADFCHVLFTLNEFLYID